MTAAGVPRWELVVFDLDGTLIDSSKDIHRAVNLTLTELGYPPRSLDEVHDALGDGARSLITHALPREARHRVDEALAVYRAHYANNLVVDTQPYPGIDALLRGACGPLAVATNKPVSLTEPLLERLGWSGLFKGVLGGDSLARPKPDRVVLETLCARLGASPRATLMVGDGPQDILAAKNARTWSCAVGWGYRAEAARACGPDFSASVTAELRALLS